MELRHLRYFVTVADEAHFGRAAKRLHIAQPALSQQIRTLERQLGMPLLDRTTRRVELTEPGRILLSDARRILGQVDDAMQRLHRVAAGESGLLRIGFVSSAAFGMLPRVVQPFRASRPDVALELQEMLTSAQLEALQHGDLDLGIGRDVREAPGVRVLELLREPLVAALPATHPLTQRRRLAVTDLAMENFIALPQDRVPGLYGVVAALCDAAGFQLKPAITARQFTTMLGLVSAGMGVAVVPAAVRAFHPAGLVYRQLADTGAVTAVDLLIRPASETPALRSFIDLARSHGPA